MSDYLGILSRSLKNANYDKVAHDQIGKMSPVWAKISARKPKATHGDYTTWTARVKYPGLLMDGSMGWVADATLVDPTQQARVANKDILQPLFLSVKAMKHHKAAGPDALFDYVDENIKTAIDEFAEHMANSVFSDGSAITNAKGKVLPRFDGLKAVATRDATYANISPATYSAWQGCGVNIMSATGGTPLGLTFSGSAPTWANMVDKTSVFYIPRIISLVVDYCTPKQPGPDMITTDSMYFELLHQLIADKQQVTTNSWGFRTFNYKGIDVVFDPLQPLGTISVWSTDHMDISALPETMLKIGKGDMKEVVGTDFVFGSFGITGNLIFKQRRRFGHIYNLPVTFS